MLSHHAANHMRGHTRIIPLGWGADAPKTASVVVQASYTEPRGDGEPDLNASALEKVKKLAKTGKRSSIWLHFNGIGESKAECRICQIKITFRAGVFFW